MLYYYIINYNYNISVQVQYNKITIYKTENLEIVCTILPLQNRQKSFPILLQGHKSTLHHQPLRGDI